MTSTHPFRRLRNAALALAGLLLSALPLTAAPRDELLRLVPDDVGFCLVIQDLRTHADNLTHSPFAAQFAKTTFGVSLSNSPELAKISEFEQELKKHFGVTAAQLRDEIYGDALAFAYRPSPDGKPEGEEGIFLLRARDKTLLARLITQLNDAQTKSKELKAIVEHKHDGVTYMARVGENATHFYYLNGPVLAYTSQESMLKRVIDLDRRDPGSAPTIGRDMRRLEVHDAMLALWLNPRAFDADLKRKVAQAKPNEVHSLKRIQQYWQALDGAAFTLTPRKSALEASVGFLAREGEMPEAAKKFFAGDNRPSELWGRFPTKALVAVAGRIDVPVFAHFLGDFLPPDDRKKMRETAERFISAPSGGLDLFKDILPNLGPDWGFCLLPPGDKDKAVAPLLIAALRVSPGENKDKPVDRALFEVLDRLAGMAVIFSQDPLALEKTRLPDKTEVKYLHGEKGAAANIQPAFALKDGYLLLGSTPGVLQSFGVGRPAGETMPECPLIRISYRELRGYLKSRMDQLAPILVEKHQISTEEAKRRLQGVIDGCQLFERLEFTRRTGPGRVTLTARLHTEQPLTK
jgi:hypothetical protein